MAKKIEPAKQRSTITASENGLEMVIPPRPRGGDVLVGLGVAFFVFITVSISYELLADLRAGETRGLIVGIPFLIAIGTFGAFLAYTFLWRVVGREKVKANSDVLAICLDVAGLKRAYEFDPRQIQRLRSTPPTRDWHAGALGIGTIAFECGAKTYRFGFAVDEAEAGVLVAAIKQACRLGVDYLSNRLRP